MTRCAPAPISSGADRYHRRFPGRRVDTRPVVAAAGQPGVRPCVPALVQEVNEREAAEKALRESEQRFRALVHNASDAFTVISADGLVRYQSPAVEQALGYPREELIGRALLDLVHPDNRKAAERLFEPKIQRDPSTLWLARCGCFPAGTSRGRSGSR
jgi:PAS domain-containing protein